MGMNLESPRRHVETMRNTVFMVETSLRVLKNVAKVRISRGIDCSLSHGTILAFADVFKSDAPCSIRIIA